jgi:HSP20 family protein
MLMRTDPPHQLERWTRQLFDQQGTRGRPTSIPIDAYREGEQF